MIRHSSYDVLVVGAGPAGCVTAIAHARRGAKVLLLEADPLACSRFAGEWLHTSGVAVLDALRLGHLESARARAGYGFVIFPDDGGARIDMPYRDGIALAGEHGELVRAMRAAAAAESDVEIAFGIRATHIAGNEVELEDRKAGTTMVVRAGRIVGADGRRSTVRRSLDIPDRSAAVSAMAAVELHNIELPAEGFGHIYLGGPGPALFYRITENVVRGCLDVPVSFGAAARSREFVWESFSQVLPEPLRGALRESFERDSTHWAINRFRPRTVFGRDHIALIGDSVGHVHPMTASGMTLGLLDGYTLAQSETVEQYARERRSYVPELLSNALYHCFRREDESAETLRKALLDTLRNDPEERLRTMDILSSSDLRRRTFGAAFMRVAVQATRQLTKDTVQSRDVRSLPRTLAGFAEWMQWPAALAVPSLLDTMVRAESSTTHPIPQLAHLVPTASPIDAPKEDPASRRRGEVALSEPLAAGSGRLLTELEGVAARFGTVPDADLAGPALGCMRAILATEMAPAMAARMTLGRRRLAVDGFGRLLDEPACVPLSELLLVLLEDGSLGADSVESLTEAIRGILDCQHRGGGFGRVPGSKAELRATSLATSALSVVLLHRPDSTDADLHRSLERAETWLREMEGQLWGVAPKTSQVEPTADALEALAACGVPSTDPVIRRGVALLSTVLEPVARDAPLSSTAAVTQAARALHAVVAHAGRISDTTNRVARRLAELLVDSGVDDWATVAAVVRSLADLDARRRRRPRKRPAPRKSRKKPGSTQVKTTPITPELEDDWAFCKEALGQVSRTFARPIALLTPRLEVAVSLGYLLCRIADTIEDHPALTLSQRDELFQKFLALMEDRGAVDQAKVESVEAAFSAVEAEDDAELRLGRDTGRVMRVFAAQDDAAKAATRRWVPEMARGMSLYTHREPGADGVSAVYTVADLDRYCYYVAGTVGHFLTDLFIDDLGLSPHEGRAQSLRDEAENFASGLQLTNILKDVTDDLGRGVCFLPRLECERQGLAPAELADEAVRHRAHLAVEPLFDLAKRRLDGALRYALTIPPEQTAVRLFCLLPLWMAARTLVLAKGNDAMFIPSRPVKISRKEVEGLIGDCLTNSGNDDALRGTYQRLFAETPAIAASS